MYRTGFVQFCPVRYDVERNIASIMGLASGVKADLLVLPELSNSGYLYQRPEQLAPYSEPADGSGPFLSALRQLAGETGGLIVSGFSEQAREGLYNSAAAVDAGGVRQVYRKTHLFGGEKDLFLPGNSGFGILDYQGGKIGMMVCFDWAFPESARTLALRGALILAHPANLVLPGYCQQGMVTRSFENQVFSVTANRYGREELGDTCLGFTGGSQLLDTKGHRLLQAPPEGDCVAVTGIDLSAAGDKHVTERNDLFADRRPDMYWL